MTEPTLHTVRRGSPSPDRPVLVFLHGLGTSTATWDAVTQQLSDRYLTVAVDLPGHGASPHPEDPAAYTRDAALAGIDAVIEDLAGTGTGRPVLIGHSLGGYLTLAHAATRPDVAAGLVVLNTGPGFRDAEKREAWNERSRRNWHRFGVSERAAGLNLQHDGVVMERLADIVVPTLFLAGGDDSAQYQGAGAYLERKMPDARLVVLPGGGHSMHEDTHAGEVADLIAELAAGLANDGR